VNASFHLMSKLNADMSMCHAFCKTQHVHYARPITY